MKTTLLFNTPLLYAASAIRMSKDNHHLSDSHVVATGCIGCNALMHDGSCSENAQDTCENYNTFYKTKVIGEKDKALIDRVGVKMHHESTLEMVDYIWDVELSTKTLLALTRHRIGVSMCVRSTRYTTHKLLKNIELFDLNDFEKASMYLELGENHEHNRREIQILNLVIEAVQNGEDNDTISLLLPQSFIYRAQLKMNARSLRHFVSLRNEHTHAHWQIKNLCSRLLSTIPEEHKFLYEDVSLPSTSH